MENEQIMNAEILSLRSGFGNILNVGFYVDDTHRKARQIGDAPVLLDRNVFGPTKSSEVSGEE